jgi:phage FluMu protein Com
MNEIRCQRCNARLFDTDMEARQDAQGVDPRTTLVIVRIKCWRCKTLVDVYLFAKGDRIGAGYAALPPEERREAA